jgi:hypothetical protein
MRMTYHIGDYYRRAIVVSTFPVLLDKKEGGGCKRAGQETTLAHDVPGVPLRVGKGTRGLSNVCGHH